MRRLEMPELEHLRNFAAAARRGGFNVPFFRLDGNSGEYRRTGKTNTGPMNNQKLACDPVDAMTGYQKFENKIPIYQIGRVADGYQPPPREELGDMNEFEWGNGKDPWVRIDLLPFWDVESREVLLFSAANQGSRDAVANLVGAYINNIEVHPEDLNKVPLVELETDSYVNKHGKKIFYPIFEIVDWIERPAAVRRILPPPVKMLELTAAPSTTTPMSEKTAVVAPPAESSSPISAKSDQREPVATKAKPKKSGGHAPASDMDDEIPFAPEWRG
jgi:hypothetical protein